MSELSDTLAALHAKLAGSLVDTERAQALAVQTPPPPPPSVIPPGSNVVILGAQRYPLAAIDPTVDSNRAGVGFPGLRGTNQLLAYTSAGARTGTNGFGTERTVIGGFLGPEVTGLDGGLVVPANGLVLSGHANAGSFLRSGTTGMPVTYAHTDVPPPPPPPPPLTGRTIAMYLLDGVGHVSQFPAAVTQARVAFLQGTKLVEWGGDTPAQTAAALTSWHAMPGAHHDEILISIGGQGGAVAESTVPAAIRAVMQVPPTIPVGGIDWDKEAGALDVGAAVDTSVALAQGRPGWLTAFTPSGGLPVATYLSVAKECKRQGIRVQFSQQLYDTRIDLADVLRQTELAAGALGPENVLIGCMVGDDPAKYSTVAQWATYVGAAVHEFPTLGGVVLWESSRPGTGAWVTAMQQALATVSA